MTALRSSTGQGQYVASEWSITTGTAASWLGLQPPCIYAHGGGITAFTLWGTQPDQMATVRALAEAFTVSVADLGGDLWGSDTHVSRIASLDTYLQGNIWLCAEPVVLVGASMGALGVLGRALTTPARVAGVVCVIPALDLNDIHANNRGGSAASINTAYGGAYDNATMGPTHNPVEYAGDLDPDLPIHLFTSSNDTLALPATADAFVTARPQTTRTDMGAVGHGDSSFNGWADEIAAAAVAML